MSTGVYAKDKLSPGPWRWKEKLERGGYPDEMPVLLDADGMEVCNFGDSTQYYPTEGAPPGDADAALIADARTMLDLLAEPFKATCMGRGMEPRDPCGGCWNCRVDVLLAKHGRG